MPTRLEWVLIVAMALAGSVGALLALGLKLT